jgi:uncharacterized membrane protein YbhN (UPF0104 family)
VKRVLTLLLGALGVSLLAWFAVHFPWGAAGRSIGRASLPLVVLVTMANLLSLAAKGAAWRVLLHRHARPGTSGPGMRDAVAATMVGAAVGSLGPSVAGEAARLRFMVGRGGVTLGAGLSAVVASRVLEAVSLIAVVALAGFLLPPSPWTHMVRLAAPLLLFLCLSLSRPPLVQWLAVRLPARLAGSPRRALLRWAAELGAPGVPAAIWLSTLNWFMQWLAYAGAAMAVGLPRAPVLGLAALLIANVGGALRVTPGNVGVLQASFALAASIAGVSPIGAVAASLLLQAAQILPVLAAGLTALLADRARTVPSAV